MKKLNLIFVLGIAILFLVPSVLSISYVCCEQVGNKWCQNVEASSCTKVLSSSTTCAGIQTCTLGTCIDSANGECEADVPKIECQDAGRTWLNKDASEVSACQKTCCVVGNNANYVDSVECARQENIYNVKAKYLSGFSSQKECQEKANANAKGACSYVASSGATNCYHTTRDECISGGRDFHIGKLCTAPGISDCAIPITAKTKCAGASNEDVYFLDTCNNIANIFDSSKKSDIAYWTDIKKDYSDGDYDGNCDYINKGNMCKPDNGGYKCVDSAKCSFTDQYGRKTEYDSGERWCYNEGALNRDLALEIELETNTFKSSTTKVKLENGYRELNLPGSRYYLMICDRGEIIVEPCADYRNQICKEGLDYNEVTKKSTDYAVCAQNRWQGCIYAENKTSCEADDKDCKWLGWGYRFDGTVLPYYGVRDNPNGASERASRDEGQGACVPLFSPGLDFWNGDGGNAIADTGYCGLGSMVETAVFERGIGTSSDELFQKGTKEIAKRCFQGACFAIPDYGLEDKNLAPYKGLGTSKSIEQIHEGTDERDLKDKYLSERRGYYCHKSGDPNKTKTGKISGELQCAEDVDKRNQIPIFTNHGVWVDFLQERARSLGDCGYKEAAWSVPLSDSDKVFGNPTSEVLSAEFQKLNQKGEITKDYASKNIYIADKRFGEGYRSSGVFERENGVAFYWRNYNWWKKLHPGETPYLGNNNKIGSQYEEEDTYYAGSDVGFYDEDEEVPDFGEFNREDGEEDEEIPDFDDGGF